MNCLQIEKKLPWAYEVTENLCFLGYRFLGQGILSPM